MNRKQTIKTGLLLLIAIILFTACSTQTEVTASQSADHDSDHVSHVETPREFAGLTNPYADDSEAIAAGEVTYTTLCASCHGESGDGDGVAAAGLTPSPAKLSDGAMMGMVSDDYLFWRISKGGAIEPFNSSMVAWESALTEEQRWQVISYIRTLSDEGGMMGDGHMDDTHSD